MLIREKKIYDSATPSGNSVELLNLIQIARLTENPELEAKAVEMETSFSENIKRAPIGYTYFLTQLTIKLDHHMKLL